MTTKKTSRKPLRKPSKSELPPWYALDNAYMQIVQGDRQLVVGCIGVPGDPKICVFAVESVLQGTTEDVFDDHAHADLGKFLSFKKAVTVAERYARKWLKKRIKTTKCNCGEITN